MPFVFDDYPEFATLVKSWENKRITEKTPESIIASDLPKEETNVSKSTIFFPISVILAYLIFCIFLARKTQSKDDRTKFLWKLFCIAGLSFFLSCLILLFFFLPQSNLFIFTWIVYDFLIAYVFFVEFPAYMRISKYDDECSNALNDLRSELTKIPFVGNAVIVSLKEKRSKYSSFLKRENTDQLLQDFILSCENMGNYNEHLWSLTLNEVSALIDDVKKRSKHPFPKLIDILALSGLSVLIAQFLKLLG